MFVFLFLFFLIGLRSNINQVDELLKKKEKKRRVYSSIPPTEASVCLCSDDILANLLSLIPEADGTVKADSIFFFNFIYVNKMLSL